MSAPRAKTRVPELTGLPPADPRGNRGRRHPLDGLLAAGIAVATAGRGHPDKARRAHGRGRAECKKCKFAKSLTGDANVSNFTIKTKACTKA